MGKGFSLAAIPAEEFPTLLLFATGSGIAPIRALIDSEQLLVRVQRKDAGR
jgi:ferredoxin-NADP reductase